MLGEVLNYPLTHSITHSRSEIHIAIKAYEIYPVNTKDHNSWGRATLKPWRKMVKFACPGLAERENVSAFPEAKSRPTRCKPIPPLGWFIFYPSTQKMVATPSIIATSFLADKSISLFSSIPSSVILTSRTTAPGS